MQITENVRDIMRSPEYVLNSLTEHSENLNYKFERLYRIFFNEEMYYVAYQRIYAKPGNMTAGADGKTIDQMSLNRIEQLITSLKDESYQPQPSKRVYIPKKNGKMRPLGVPAFNDKLLQEVVRMILEAIYERQFEKTSHGFRPLRSCHTALSDIQKTFSGVKWFVEGDIKGFFDNINHEILIGILKERIADERFIRLIRKFLNAGYIEDWNFHNSYSGTPQGGIVSLNFKTLDKATVYGPIPELVGARALVVDDDVHTCMSVSKMLREIEMRADWSTSGKEAVIRAQEAFEENDAFKAYIIDWLMPDMNGIETVRRIRAVIGDETPIIILTAYDWSDIEQEAKEAGVTAFVEKPIFMSELRRVLTKPMEIKEETSQQTERENRYSGKKVLLVEDNELNREIATALLEEIGIIVDSVEDGTDAVERMNEVEDDRYDLIFMDIQMPKMNGYMTTREIRTLKNNKKANIPIVAMTANAFSEDIQHSLAAGMNAHVSKPVEMKVLEKTIRSIKSGGGGVPNRRSLYSDEWKVTGYRRIKKDS